MLKGISETTNPNTDSCRALWAAVLFRAVEDYFGHGVIPPSRRKGTTDKEREEMIQQYKARLKTSVTGWLKTASDNVGGFGFICEVLSLDPAKTRRGILSQPLQLPDPTIENLKIQGVRLF